MQLPKAMIFMGCECLVKEEKAFGVDFFGVLVEKGRVERINGEEFEFTAEDLFGSFNESCAKIAGRSG